MTEKITKVQIEAKQRFPRLKTLAEIEKELGKNIEDMTKREIKLAASKFHENLSNQELNQLFEFIANSKAEKDFGISKNMFREDYMSALTEKEYDKKYGRDDR